MHVDIVGEDRLPSLINLKTSNHNKNSTIIIYA